MQSQTQEATEDQEASQTQDKDIPVSTEHAQEEDTAGQKTEEGKSEPQSQEAETAAANEEAIDGGEDECIFTPDIAETPPEGITPPQPEVVMIDGVPVLEDIAEEGEEAEEGESEEVRQELLDKIMEAIAERDRMQSLSNQVQSEIAEYLARKKVIE